MASDDERRERERARSQREYERGVKDGKNNSYNRPHKDLLWDLGIGSYPENQEQDNKDYDQGWDHGRNETKKGCFLTSACIAAKDLPDDCHELSVLRGFRDEYLAKLPGGAKLIGEYYDHAPAIVEHLNSCSNSQAVYAELYETLVVASVRLIEGGQYERALHLYGSIYRGLLDTQGSAVKRSRIRE